jgi:adenylate cyclase
VVVGSVGGGGRLEFAVIGDAVNVAARAEAITRETGDEILLTEATHCLLSEKESGVEARGEAQLRGIAEPVALYSPASELDERSTLSKKTLITDA